MSVETYKAALRAAVTPERVAAWEPEHPSPDLVDYVSDHDEWKLLRPDLWQLGPADAERMMELFHRYLRLHRVTAGKAT